MSIYIDTYGIAKRFSKEGLCILPLRCDGSKSPRIKWGRYHWNEIADYFCPPNSCGIGILCGERSGGLEVLDFDHPQAFPEWAAKIDPALLAVLTIIATPSNGRHIYYRCPTIDRNMVLARDVSGDVYIETRGEGGMVVAPGSPLSVHNTEKPYTLLQGNLYDPPFIIPDERAGLLEQARLLNRYKQRKPEMVARKIDRKRIRKGLPGDWFNEYAEWEQILEPMGWEIEYTAGNVTYWRKPRSTHRKHHATTGFNGIDVLHCFSTNAPPFQEGQSYNKFAAYTLLWHNGDYRKAVKSIQQWEDEEVK